MKTIKKLLLGYLFVLIFTPVAFAQKADSSAKGILVDAVKAILALKAVRYQAETNIVFPGKKPTVLYTTGEVFFQRDPSLTSPFLGKALIKSQGSSGLQEVSYDGQKITRITHSSKIATEGKVENGALSLFNELPRYEPGKLATVRRISFQSRTGPEGPSQFGFRDGR